MSSCLDWKESGLRERQTLVADFVRMETPGPILRQRFTLSASRPPTSAMLGVTKKTQPNLQLGITDMEMKQRGHMSSPACLQMYITIEKRLKSLN